MSFNERTVKMWIQLSWLRKASNGEVSDGVESSGFIGQLPRKDTELRSRCVNISVSYKES